MPELPEVETVCRGLAPAMEGASISRAVVRRRDLRIPFPDHMAARLENRRIVHLGRRAKYILVALDDGWTLVIHLGMSGRMTVFGDGLPPPGPHDHVDFELDAGAVRFCDPRRFGLMALVETEKLNDHKLFSHLGPDPLGNHFDAMTLDAALAGKRGPIKMALLDQRVVAGLGNIYVCESLYRSGISPKRRAGTVPGKRAGRLAAAIRETLLEAIAAGGSSLRDHAAPDGRLGYFQHGFNVYDREGQPCPDCDCDVARTGGIRRLVQSGRSTFYCSRRQR